MSPMFKKAMIVALIILVAVVMYLVNYPEMIRAVVTMWGTGVLVMVGLVAVDSVYYDREVSRHCDALDAVLPHGSR